MQKYCLYLVKKVAKVHPKDPLQSNQHHDVERSANVPKQEKRKILNIIMHPCMVNVYSIFKPDKYDNLGTCIHIQDEGTCEPEWEG